MIEDQRFDGDRYFEREFLDYIYEHIEQQQQITITPHFLRHFDFQTYDQNLLLYKVKFLSLQLGFNFDNNTDIPNYSCEDENG